MKTFKALLIGIMLFASMMAMGACGANEEGNEQESTSITTTTTAITDTKVESINGVWGLYANNELQKSYTGIASNDNGDRYIANGLVDFSYNGTVAYNGETYKVVDGRATKITLPPLSEFSDNILFSDSVRNDKTGNWRMARVYTNKIFANYAKQYYDEYFKADNEVHYIVDLNQKTTTAMTVSDGTIFLTVHVYQDKEEHDANLLGGGAVLNTYHVDKNTGEITFSE